MADDRHDYPEEERRGFFTKFLAGALSVVLGAVPIGSGLAFFLDPLIRKARAKSGPSAINDDNGVQKDKDGFINLRVDISSLPEDGTPMAVKVLDDKVDAWNKFKNVAIGTVWLRRTPENEVIAFNTICPHLGCAVDYRQANRDFFCPCHTSTFNLDGERQNQIPPRDMDSLEVKTKESTGNSIWLKYQDFRGTIHEKIEV